MGRILGIIVSYAPCLGFGTSVYLPSLGHHMGPPPQIHEYHPHVIEIEPDLKTPPLHPHVKSNQISPTYPFSKKPIGQTDPL